MHGSYDVRCMSEEGAFELNAPSFINSTFSSYGVKEVKGVKGVKDNSSTMVFSAKRQGFFKEKSFVLNSFNSF